MSNQVIIIDFQADFSSITDATQELVKTGKVEADLAAQFKKTNQEIKNQGAAFDKTAQAAGKDSQSLTRLQQLMAQFPKTGMQRYLLEVGKELAAAGVKTDDFAKKSKKGTDEAAKGFKNLRQELRSVREQMQQAALSSGMLSEEYQQLAQRAGQLDDLIRDVNDDIRNTGSDTRGLDNVVGAIGAVAGGFSAVQGATALFADESEDLQKALLKVNAAMAIASGLQQVQAALTKQGALARIADVTATNLQIATQRIYTFVTGRATAATVAFKVALATTGIGLVIVAVIALANAFKQQKSDVDDATEAIEAQKAALERMNAVIDRQTNIAVANAEAAGKAESEVMTIRGKGINEQITGVIKQNRALKSQRDALSATSEAWFLLNKQIGDNDILIDDLNTQAQILFIQRNAQIASEQKKASDEAVAKAKEAADKAREEAKKARAAGFADFKAGIELQLLAVEQGSAEELAIRKKLLNAQLQIDLEAENLTLNQRKLLIQTYFKSRKDIEAKFNKELVAQATEAEKNRLQATLANLSLGEEERLAVRIEFLQISAQAELQAAEGNAAKIKLINAELNAAIAAAKIESIRRTAEEEARLASATGGPERRALQAVASNEQMKTEVRINAIRQLGQVEADAIDKEIAANLAANAVKGADNRSLNIEYEELLDKKRQKTEETEKAITDITKSENKKRQEANIAYIQATLAGLTEVANIVGGIQQNQQLADEQAITTQRRRVEELLEAGAITEKEAERRNKKIEAEERAVKNRAAQQQKKLAVFNALLAIPQAFIAGLTAPFPIGGPIYGAILAALAAAQAGVVASRPVPKFATGKKGTYKGPGVVGDAGAELIQRADGSLHIATKPQLVYLGAQDKVFTASETRSMMPMVNKEAIAHKGGESINYDKMAAAILKTQRPGKSPIVNVDNTEVGQEMVNALLKNDYWNRYYKSK